MILIKESSGVIFDEQFKTNSDWQLTNPNATTIGSGSLTIDHLLSSDVMVLKNIPSDANAFEVSIDYTPLLENDSGGLILYNNEDEFSELLESEDATQAHLENIKVIREGNNFDFYMQRNNIFEYINSVDYPFRKIGFIAKQGQSTFKPLIINRFVATKNNRLQVKNLPGGFSVAFEYGDEVISAVVDIFGSATIELPHLVVAGTLKLLDGKLIVVEQTTEFFGGDIYYYGSSLLIQRNGVSLDEINPNEIGSVNSTALELQLELYNQSTSAIDNIQLTIQKYSMLFGYEWADIAEDISGSHGTYSDVLNIDRINAQQIIPFWIRVEKTGIATSAEKVFFEIKINHD